MTGSIGNKALEGAIAETQSFPLFEDFSPQTLRDLCCNGRVIVNAHREVLFRFGEEAKDFGIVLSGAYKLSRPTPQGDDAIAYFAIPGDVVGALIMSQAHPKYPVTATAMGPSRFLLIPKANYLSAWRQNSALIGAIQSQLSLRMSFLQGQIALSRSPLSAKIAALLLELLNRQDDQTSAALQLPLTRKEIADSLGASVESVIRVMSEWSKQGMIRTSDQQITILKPEKMVATLTLN